MNSVNEKEKKLISVLSELKSLKLHSPEIKQKLEVLSAQKNQLEIEKEDLEKKYKSLMDDYNNLSLKLDEIKNHEKIEQKKQIEFNCLNFLISSIEILLYPVRYNKE